MIILDTNVVSELMDPDMAPAVENFFFDYDDDELFTTSITVAEILFGIEILPVGKKKKNLSEQMEKVFNATFNQKILIFDEIAARTYASLSGNLRKKGITIGAFDRQIAAIALVHDAALATRNIRHFKNCGIKLINPWDV